MQHVLDMEDIDTKSRPEATTRLCSWLCVEPAALDAAAEARAVDVMRRDALEAFDLEQGLLRLYVFGAGPFILCHAFGDSLGL